MVTDNVAYIGTSNWSADYFTDTAGVGLVMEDPVHADANGSSSTIRSELASVFERDWNSKYSTDLKPPKETENYDLPYDLSAY